MRKFCVLFAILAGVASMQAQKTRESQKTRMGEGMPYAKPGVNYPLTFHLYGLHVRSYCEDGQWAGQCANALFLDVVASAGKLDLNCGTALPELPSWGDVPLAFGDLPARLVKKASGTPLMKMGDRYELLLPNRRVLGCVVSGMME